MAELGDFLVSGDTTVNIDVEMLDYGFIGKCNDAKILRGIVETLKSGREGIYPELCQAAEDRLLAVLPEKERRRIMRLKHETTPDQVNDAKHDLDSWQSEVCVLDQELRCSEPSTQSAKKKLPPVRGQKKVEKLDVPTPRKQKEAPQAPPVDSKQTQRLSGYDFHAWEKFNVEEALSSLDEEEREQERAAENTRAQKQRAAEEAARGRMRRHAEALEAIRAEMNISDLSSVQRKTRAAREKQKGNESFRSGENDEAYTYYSRSLALDDSVAAVYSNRALVCLRTGKLETAEDDCSRALFLDPTFTKARSRRGIARLKSGKYELAIRDFSQALEHDAANKELASLLQKAKDKYLEVEGKEYVSEADRERQKAALQLAIANGLPVKVTAAASAAALLLPVAGGAAELLSSGVCEIVENPAETLTRILIEEDSDSGDEDEDEEGGDCETEGFTRIHIDEASDTEEEDEGGGEQEQEQEQQNEQYVPQRVAEGEAASDGFVRIAITDDSDTESDGDEQKQEQRRESEEENQKRRAEELKAQANAAMQGGDLATAIRLYGECVAIDESSPVAIAAYGNRSLAHLKLEQYAQVLADTNKVLSHEPRNLKALYRRSLAHEASGDLDSAIADVDDILRIQPQNALALEARERFCNTKQIADAAAARVSAEANSGEGTSSEVTSGKVGAGAKADVEKSSELKAQGNEAMKAGRCDEAVELYTRAIACDPSNLLLFNNRAQAFIKTAQFKQAEADASHVIQHSAQDSPNMKAYYRRALARKGVDTIESLTLAQDDVLYILSCEPDNKAAVIEKQKIASLLKAKVELKREAERKAVQKRLAPQEPGADGGKFVSGLTERSSTLKARNQDPRMPPAPTPAAEPAQQVDASSSLSPSLSSTPSEKEKKTTGAAASNKTTAARDISVKNPVVPATPPKTVYEFERIWRGLKNRPDLFAQYLRCFKKSTFKKVLKETCSPDLLSSMLVAVRDHLLRAEEDGGNVERGVSVLEGLCSSPKYDMMRCVLPGADLECMKVCLDYVSVHDGPQRAQTLREKLKI